MIVIVSLKLITTYLRYEVTMYVLNLQGVQDQKCQKEMAISLEGSTFHTTLIKPKYV